MKCAACPSTNATRHQIWHRGRVKVVGLCKSCLATVDYKRQRQRNAQRAKRPLAVVTKSPEQK